MIMLLWCILIVFVAACSKEPKLSFRQLTDQVMLYEKVEFEIQLIGEDFLNPYDATEIALDMKLASPKGNEITLPCYFESGDSVKSLWKARFAAKETGVYNYHFELKKGNDKALRSDKSKFRVLQSSQKGFLSVNNFWTLKYDNGEVFRGIGENIGWESRDEDDSKYFKKLHEDPRFNYEYLLTKLSSNGGNFFRTWMIYWNLPVDWKTVHNNSRYENTSSPYNESGMKRMDYLVDLCDSLGIHMMLALESHVGYMGMGWETSSYNISNGGFAKTPLEFFTLPSARSQYKNKLRLMVARYGYSPSISAWEFFNEIDNVMYHGDHGIPDSVITDWHNEMSAYLEEIDPYDHIVTTSVSHRDVSGMNDLPNIDINQRHIYKNTSGIPQTLREYSRRHNKPYIIGETAYEWDWNKNFNDFDEEMDEDFKRGLWYGLFSPTPVLPMSWWWEFFDERGLMHYFNNVRQINDLMLDSGNGSFRQLEIDVRQCTSLAVKCGDAYFVYLFNESSVAVNETVVIHSSTDSSPNYKVRSFSPDDGRYADLNNLKVEYGNMTLSGLKIKPRKDLILIVRSKGIE